MDLESQDPRFNANLGLDQNIIRIKKLRCSHPKSPITFSVKGLSRLNYQESKSIKSNLIQS